MLINFLYSNTDLLTSIYILNNYLCNIIYKINF